MLIKSPSMHLGDEQSLMSLDLISVPSVNEKKDEVISGRLLKIAKLRDFGLSSRTLQSSRYCAVDVLSVLEYRTSGTQGCSYRTR
jgi:hypothetical protein